MFIALLCLVTLSGCSRRPPNSRQTRGEIISEYLPIRLSDQFRLTIGRLPHEKTDFHESELTVIYRFISSFSYYGPNPPWYDLGVAGRPLGLPIILYASSEEHETTIQLIPFQRGHFASVRVDDEPEQWFEVDSDAFDDVVELVR